MRPTDNVIEEVYPECGHWVPEEKDADDLAAEEGLEMPPLPPIPLQLDPSNGIPRRSQRQPGEWCQANGVTPPPGSFQQNMTMATGG